MTEESSPPRVFISHSTADAGFVTGLADDLASKGPHVWYAPAEIPPGGSIVDSIGSALGASDYVVLVLSERSVTSRWVQAEVNAAMMRELSDGGTVVIPALLEDVELPVLLRDRMYADFREDYASGVDALLEVIGQESEPFESVVRQVRPLSQVERCCQSLALLRDGDLRRRLHRRFDRSQIRAIWHAVMGSDMEDDMLNRDKLTCALELVIRCRRQELMPSLYREICLDDPDAANDSAS